MEFRDNDPPDKAIRKGIMSDMQRWLGFLYPVIIWGVALIIALGLAAQLPAANAEARALSRPLPTHSSAVAKALLGFRRLT